MGRSPVFRLRAAAVSNVWTKRPCAPYAAGAGRPLSCDRVRLLLASPRHAPDPLDVGDAFGPPLGDEVQPDGGAPSRLDRRPLRRFSLLPAARPAVSRAAACLAFAAISGRRRPIRELPSEPPPLIHQKGRPPTTELGAARPGPATRPARPHPRRSGAAAQPPLHARAAHSFSSVWPSLPLALTSLIPAHVPFS